MSPSDLESSNPRQPSMDDLSFLDSIKKRIDDQPYWFHRIDLGSGLVTPGWSDPRLDKLPYYGLPEDMTGMRVLDVGAAEGFFSFEAERRGASEVIAIDSFPDSTRRFGIVRDALGSEVNAYLCNVYDLDERRFGTFDYVFFFGVLYHLRHPLLALERIFSVCRGTMLMQTLIHEDLLSRETPSSQFHPFGIKSGPPDAPIFDPTVFWVPNQACVRAMAAHVGFTDIVDVQSELHLPFVIRAESPGKAQGTPPDQSKAPWS